MGGLLSRYRQPIHSVPYKECARWGSGPEAAESERCWNQCKKNPGHSAFIPVTDFGLQNLPEAWQKEDFVNLIKTWSDLTVRLRVRYTETSGHNENDPNSPGGQGQRAGTGFVLMIRPTTGLCPCFDCRDQPRHQQKSWTFYICTAKHVVDDDSEVATVCVDFFYDCIETREDGRMKTLKGIVKVDADSKCDWCEFTCVSHDEQLAAKITSKLVERMKLWKNLGDWMVSLEPKPQIIVSHPHGKPKYVTIGERKNEEKEDDMWTYTTATCPGSSGAHVLGWRWEGLGYGLHHCQGGEDGGPNIGYFSQWW